MSDDLNPHTRMTWSAKEWFALFEMSGQTAAKYCRENDLSPATLSVWLRQQQPAGDTELVDETTSALAPAAMGCASVTMQLPSGTRLEMSPGTDVAWLAQLLRAVGA